MQETKIVVWNEILVQEICGQRIASWLSLPLWGSSSGILVWNDEKLKVLDNEVGAFSISIQCRVLNEFEDWVFSGVYGPTLYLEVAEFLGELDNVRACWDYPGALGRILTRLDSLMRERGK